MEKTVGISEKVPMRYVVPAVALALGLTVGCSGETVPDTPTPTSRHRTNEKASVCQIATKNVVSKYTKIDSADLSKSSCASDTKSGVIGQQRWTLKVGESTASGELVTTLIREDTANKASSFSFATLGNNVPAALKQQRNIAGGSREVYISDNGMAVSLGELTLAVSLEPTGTASATEVAPITLDPAFHADGAQAVAETLSGYVEHLAAKVQEG